MRSVLLLFFLLCFLYVCEAKQRDIVVSSPCVDGVTRKLSQVRADNRSWDEYDFVRDDVIAYMKLGFDQNGDGYLSERECNEARNFYFSPFELQWGETCRTVILRCDCDGDGLISLEDFQNSYMTCLRRGIDGARIKYLIGGRITEKGAFKGKIAPSKDMAYPDIKGE